MSNYRATSYRAIRTVRGATGLKVCCMTCGWDEEVTDSDDEMRKLSGRARYHVASLNHVVHVWRETLFVYQGERRYGRGE